MNEHTHEGLVAGMAVSAILSIGAMFIAMGPCIQQEKVRGEVEHLERRLDNIRDGNR